jgi:hypothetical protein
LLRLPALISARSMSIQTASQCWNRACRAKARGAFEADSRDGLHISTWNSGYLCGNDNKAKSWPHWHLPDDAPEPYTANVNEINAVWVSDRGANANSGVPSPSPAPTNCSCGSRSRGGEGHAAPDPGFASSRRADGRTTPVSDGGNRQPRGWRGCFRDCLFHNAPDIYCHTARPPPRSSPLTGTRGQAWRRRLRGGVPRPRSLKRAFPERQIRRPNLGPHSPNSLRAVRRKARTTARW